ncbi:MAG: hypothetical protein MZV70_45870 [Desulfobacterales bacterium]|nr:hypothetical protein [Desulfobacterales bacterium]
MKLEFIEARDLPDAWFSASELLEASEYLIEREAFRGRKGWSSTMSRSTSKYPGVRPLLPDIPPALGIPNPVAEGISTPISYLHDGGPNGPRKITRTGNFSAIEEVIRMYREGGSAPTSAMTVEAVALFLESALLEGSIDTRVRDNKLHFAVYFRCRICGTNSLPT